MWFISMPSIMILLPLVIQWASNEKWNKETPRALRLIARNIALTIVPLAWIVHGQISMGWVDFERVGPQRVLAEVCLLLIMVDTIFYFVHRTLHSRLLYPWHKTHHSFRPTQTTCYVAMSLFEFVFENLVYFVLGPVLGRLWGGLHLYSWGLANLYVLFHGTLIHNSRLTVNLGRMGINSAPNHQLHHKFGQKNSNFGLLFTVWDHLCGTYSD